ncbi:hypothetical protein SCB49_03319 [unidentified eubacterium SCB49]|nr:hypothetical protein SCB49_03319 [unidentified eubacterium SCB49]
MLKDLGFKNPQVYIHTGNWVFESHEKEADLSRKISEAILQKYGWELPVIVIAATAFKTIFDNCPFTEEKKEKSYFVLLSAVPSSENLVLFNDYSFPNETFQLVGRCVYFYATISAARVKMNTNFIEKKLNVSATSRNFNSMAKLITIASS